MEYIKAEKLDMLKDNESIYVNRNVLNSTIAKYEINIEHLKCEEELKILLSVWNDVYELEKRTNRIQMFIKMSNKEVKKCFKNYKTLPLGSFGIL